MFTGIVQRRCPVVASVANNGRCLTASHIDGTRVRFDVVGETLELTNLGPVAVGDRVNIERSLRFGDELGGHILSGHVAGTATVAEIVAAGANRTMWFDIDPDHMPYLMWKGRVALDGASLTISRVDRETDRIAVSLIPETLERTTLGEVEVGDRVNLELDAQTQTIVRTVRDLLTDPTYRAQLLGDE